MALLGAAKFMASARAFCFQSAYIKKKSTLGSWAPRCKRVLLIELGMSVLLFNAVLAVRAQAFQKFQGFECALQSSA